ncbi:MAG: hypothetical protein HUU45_13485 [Leptospiraceae bacterium]|nr:hypothetical protein [Leptospiraceae bacterium]
MPEYKAVVRIDLCGSKSYFDRYGENNETSRVSLLQELIKTVKEIYPHADKSFPEGSLYNSQGDSVSIILDKPTVAVRATIEFMKIWSSKLNTLPDCRTVIDYGEIQTVGVGIRSDLVGTVFENLSAIEKLYSDGQIGVTESVISQSDRTIVQYTNERAVSISNERKIKIWLANYENPRVIEDSSLVHALFIADPSGDEVRIRTFEALIIECIVENGFSDIKLESVNSYFRRKNCPVPEKTTIEEILKKSKFLKRNKDFISLREETYERIGDIRKEFQNARQDAIDKVTNAFSSKLGVSKEILAQKLSIQNLIEEYLCAVFLEIRMMANYFRSTNSLFQRLSDSNEFDYIIFKNLEGLIAKQGKNKEQYGLIKTIFVKSLVELAEQQNKYIAAVFHNVLSLYYLNRNSRYAHGQLSKIREKEIFLDTNSLYAYLCEASNYYSLLHYSLEKLTSMGARIKLFDKSLEEYNESLNFALKRHQGARQAIFFWDSERPWIWEEFQRNLQKYNNNFEYCVALHRIPQGVNRTTSTAEQIKTELADKRIELVELKPFCDQIDLGYLYEDVYEAKKRQDSSTTSFRGQLRDHEYHVRVLHDANCLRYIKDKFDSDAANPFAAKALFVTCDFRLAKIRRKAQDRFNFLVTIAEFYEYMLPYLFLEDIMIANPIEMPNFLLASTLSRELYISNSSIESLFGSFLASTNEKRGSRDFQILSELSETARFKKVQEKHKALAHLETMENPDKFVGDYTLSATELFAEYLNKVKESVAETMIQERLYMTQKDLDKSKTENEILRKKIETLEQKRKKGDRYKQKQRKRKK